MGREFVIRLMSQHRVGTLEELEGSGGNADLKKEPYLFLLVIEFEFRRRVMVISDRNEP